jgi:hypothetical protein
LPRKRSARVIMKPRMLLLLVRQAPPLPKSQTRSRKTTTSKKNKMRATRNTVLF